MKRYTKEEHAALIADCKEDISDLQKSIDEMRNSQGGASILKRLNSLLIRQEIALAALTAEPLSATNQSHIDSLPGDYEVGMWSVDAKEDGDILLYTTPPVAALKLPELGSGVVNEAAWLLHDKLAEGGPLTGHQFNNLKGSFYGAMKVALGATAEEKK